MNYDRFCNKETAPDEISKIKTSLGTMQGMETIPAEEILLMVQDSLKLLMKERNIEFPKIDQKKLMEDASFLFRRLIMRQTDDTVMKQAMSIFWHYLIFNVDFILQGKQKEYEYYKNQVDDRIQYELGIKTATMKT